MVIVTRNQFILAEKIQHITMDQVVEFHDVRGSDGRYRSVKDLYHRIQIWYQPSNSSPNARQDHTECTVIIRGRKDAHDVFADIIRQIREHNPDDLFLDKALEKLLSGETTDYVLKQDKKEKLFLKPLMGQDREENDGSTKKVRKSRKTKRRSKKVLRKSKARR